jgi:hypothetical protein
MKKEIVFFIDQEQFKTDATELTVRELLQDFAKCDPSETTLVIRHGNDLRKLTDLDQVVPLENGMKFVVYHNSPTTVS